MTINEETAFEMAIATNVNWLMYKYLKESARIIIELMEKETERNPQLESLEIKLFKMKTSLDIIMDHYNEVLGQVSDADPDARDRIKARVADSDLIHALELNLAMSSSDHYLQHILKGKN